MMFLPKSLEELGSIFVGDQGVPQHLPVEAVDAHRGIGGLGNRGLLLKFIDGVVRVGIQDAEAAGLFQGNVAHGDGAGGLVLFVVFHHGGIVHLIDVVAGEDHHIVRIKAIHEVDVLGRWRWAVPLYQPDFLSWRS